MKITFRNLLLVPFSLIIFFCLLESLALLYEYLSDPKVPSNILLYRQEFHKRRRDLHPFYKTYFCDQTHKTEIGNKLKSDLLMNLFDFGKYQNIAAFGGSTMEERECSPKQVNWTDNLSRLFPQKEIINYGKSSKNSDYSIAKLKEIINSGKKIELVLWGHWINEFLVNGDQRDNNYEILKKEFDLGINHEISKIHTFIDRLNYTFYTKIAFWRLASNSIIKLSSNIPFNAFMRHNENDGSYPQDLDFFPEAFKNNRQNWIKYSLKNYEINLNQLHELEQRYNFEVVIVYPPHIENYYLHYNKELNNFLEFEWYAKVHALMKYKAKEFKWAFIDLHEKFKFSSGI